MGPLRKSIIITALLGLLVPLVFLPSCVKPEVDVITQSQPTTLRTAKPAKPISSVLVKFKATVGADKRTKILAGRGRVAEKIPRLGVFEVKVDPAQVDESVSALKKDPSVEYAEPNRLRSMLVTPNDTYYKRQWAYGNMGGPKGWDVENGTTSPVTIAVVDTGVDLTHPDLKSKVVSGYDTINNDDDPSDDHGHGTHVAGIAAAITNNTAGVAGTDWGAKIMPVKVLSGDGWGTDVTVAEGIIWAADHGAKVINMSLGGYGFSQTMQDATDYANEKGVVICAAAGNEATTDILYPAGNSGVLGIAALDVDGARAWFSNYNSSVDLAAPGVYVLSTFWRDGHAYAYLSGTSMATPFASGTAALVASRFPTLSSSEIASRLQSHSVDLGPLGRDNYYGYGRIDLPLVLSDNASRITARISKRTIVYPQKAKLYGAVRPAKARDTVTIKRRYVGTRTWRTMSSGTTNSAGLFSVQVPASRSAYFKVTRGNTVQLRVTVKRK